MGASRPLRRRQFLWAAARRKIEREGGVSGSVSLAGSIGVGFGGSGAWAAGSDAPEKKEVKIGFIPLTDCASVVMASVMKFDEKYGIKIIPTKEASWASVRDKLVNGELRLVGDIARVNHDQQLDVVGNPV